jgi:hypothetical protein
LFSRQRGPGERFGDEGVARASTGGRALGHGCDRRGRRSQVREMDEERARDVGID